MSLPAKSIHVRLTPEVMERLHIFAESCDRTAIDVAEVAISEWLLGRFHALTVAAARIERLGQKRDSEG